MTGPFATLLFLCFNHPVFPSNELSRRIQEYISSTSFRRKHVISKISHHRSALVWNVNAFAKEAAKMYRKTQIDQLWWWRGGRETPRWESASSLCWWMKRFGDLNYNCTQLKPKNPKRKWRSMVSTSGSTLQNPKQKTTKNIINDRRTKSWIFSDGGQTDRQADRRTDITFSAPLLISSNTYPYYPQLRQILHTLHFSVYTCSKYDLYPHIC